MKIEVRSPRRLIGKRSINHKAVQLTLFSAPKPCNVFSALLKSVGSCINYQLTRNTQVHYHHPLRGDENVLFKSRKYFPKFFNMYVTADTQKNTKLFPVPSWLFDVVSVRISRRNCRAAIKLSSRTENIFETMEKTFVVINPSTGQSCEDVHPSWM